MNRSGEKILRQDTAIVFVIDDDPSMRTSLGDLINSVGLEVRLFASPDEFLRSERPDAPSCLVLDVRLPGMSGLAFQQELSQRGISVPIIFITGHGDIPMSVRAMKAGAIEFLVKPFHDQDLLDGIHAGLERHRARRRQATVVAELRLRYDALTEREREVMSYVVTGQPNKLIAAALGLSEVTVKVHRGQVIRKMRSKSVVELAQMADQLGMPPPRSKPPIPKS